MKTLVILALLFVSAGVQGQKATPRKATLAEQKACSEQAAKVFNEHFPDSSDATYTSHYDPEANVCYAHITQLKKRNGDSVHQEFYSRMPSRIWVTPCSTRLRPLDHQPHAPSRRWTKKTRSSAQAKLSLMLLFIGITTLTTRQTGRGLKRSWCTLSPYDLRNIPITLIGGEPYRPRRAF